MVFLTKCPRCKSQDVRLEEDMLGLYWKCPKCQYTQKAEDLAPVNPAAAIKAQQGAR
jgi:ribosomal protein L37AE/L43A